MSRMPTIPVMPKPVANVEGSGASTKAHKIRNAHSSVQIEMKTIWKPRRDMKN